MATVVRFCCLDRWCSCECANGKPVHNRPYTQDGSGFFLILIGQKPDRNSRQKNPHPNQRDCSSPVEFEAIIGGMRNMPIPTTIPTTTAIELSVENDAGG